MAKTATLIENNQPEFVSLELRTAYGPVYRDVSTRPPRDARPDEVPLIDIGGIDGSLEDRKRLAREIKHAAENIGFFYIANHQVSSNIINEARSAATRFFKQPTKTKLRVSKSQSRHFNGYHQKGTGKASRTEGLDYRESFMWSYSPELDPDKEDATSVPNEVKAWLRDEIFVWEADQDVPGFKEAITSYWQECLKLSRKMMKIFALALDLPEDYFDSVTTFPGADGVLNWYPGFESPEEAAASQDVGLGSHTDLQCLTLLFMDKSGLQVLSSEGQWLKVPAIKDTFVVNIGDYLMRLTNDRMKSTVHRVFNRGTADRLSMPFFFGFNFNEKCGVLPSCISESNPAKYEPISCGEWCELRFKKTDIEIAEDAVTREGTAMGQHVTG